MPLLCADTEVGIAGSANNFQFIQNPVIGHGAPQADLLLIAMQIQTHASKLLPRMMLAWSVRQPGEILMPPRIEYMS
jgi:hypothetical protein